MQSGPVYLNDGDEWLLAEEVPNIDFFFCQIWLRSFANSMRESCGMNYSKVLSAFEGKDMRFYYGRKNALDFALNLVKKLDANPAYGAEINRNIVRASDALEAHARSIPPVLTGKTNAELWAIIEKHVELHTEFYEWGWLPNATDMFHPELTELLKNYLRTKTASEELVNAWFVALTSPSGKSKDAMQQEEFLRIAIEIENDPFNKELFTHAQPSDVTRLMTGPVKKMLEEYHARYAPITALWVEEPASLEHFASELSHYLKQGKSPAAEFEAIDNDLNARRREKERLSAELHLDEKHGRLFEVFGNFMLTKLYRRYAQIRALYKMRSVFQEIASRFGISFDQARFMLPQEYERLLLEGNFDFGVLKEREEFCVLYCEEGFDSILLGDEARKLAGSAVQKISPEMAELTGQCASLGYAKGRVKIILSPADLPKMRQGDILVAIATNPDIVPAMKKAAAIVTEQGGVTSHAAIVSRELGVPCVIGTKVATKWLKDGDLVEVDASNGVVRKLNG